MISKRTLGFSAALVAGLLVAGVPEAEAGRGKGRGRRRTHFRSQAAPAKAKTPALAENGSSDLAEAPVAGGAAQGDARQALVDGGTLLAMSPERALVLNAFRGLSLVDTKDPSAPAVLANLAIPGTGQRMFLGAADVVVLSDVYDAEGSHVVVTSVAIGADSLTAAGSVAVDGALNDAARDGDALTIVTGEGWYGPWMLTEMGDAKPNGALKRRPGGRAGRGAGRKSLVQGPGWFGGAQTSHVARVALASDRKPTLLGVADLLGGVVASDVTGTEAVVAVQSFANPMLGLPSGANTPGGTIPSVSGLSLVRVAAGDDGAPAAKGALSLGDVWSIGAMDRSGDTLRLVEWAEGGQLVATFALGEDAITALDTISIAGWPSAFAFADGAFVYGTTEWSYQGELPDDPVFDGDELEDAYGSPGNGAKPATSGPSSSLHVVDLRDAAHLADGGSMDLGDGWVGGVTPVADGVVVSAYRFDGNEASTEFVRVALADPASPSEAGALSLSGYASVGPVLGDLMLLSGGMTRDDGAFVPQTTIANLASGGLEQGGWFDSPSWTSAAAREGDLLGVASYDRLALVSITDVDNPEVVGDLRLVVNVAGFAALGDDVGAVLTTDYLAGGVEIRTVSLPAANALAPIDSVRVGTGDAQLFAAAPFLYVVSTDWSTGRAAVTVVDATDPHDLEVRGSLDLASYPGQAFQKGSALLFLRSAWSFYDDETATDGKVAADAFGRAPRSWLKDELNAVLDVVDLADPDAPAAAARLRMRWDFAGEAILAGDALFVPSFDYAIGDDADGKPTFAYQVREIDVTDPLHPSVSRPVDVPGMLVAGGGRAHEVLTVSYRYDEADGVTSATLHVADLSKGWQERVVASASLAGYPESVTVSQGHAHVVTETWTASGSSAALTTFDAATLDTTAMASRERGAWAGRVAGGHLFLRTWGWTGSVDAYDLGDPASPVFLGSHDVAGASGDVVVAGGRAYLPAGVYGVVSFSLSD